MVNLADRELEKELTEIVEVPKDDFNWSSVSLSDVLNKGKRLEASRFNIEKLRYEKILNNSKYPLITLLNEKYADDCYNGSRTTREYVSPNNKNAVMFLGGSEILDVYPKTEKYLDCTNNKYESYQVKKNDILLTCSGTLGKVSIVSDSIKNSLVSQHVIKIRLKEFQGYLYAFLKTYLAQCLIKSNKYGSLVSHIEPEHLKEMLIPDPPIAIKKKIHDLIIQSYNNRDESNRLIDEATKLLIDVLELPSMDDLKKEAFSYSKEINSFSIKLSDLNGRLESNYHLPIIKVLENHLREKADLVKLENKEITENIVLAGVFKRNYVQKGHGYPFLGGKEITQLSPETDKYLSKITHKKRYEKELRVKENWILVTDRGTIGKVVIVPKHMENMAVSQNVLKIVPKIYPGYIYCFLNSDYGQILIKRQSYGSVVNMIDDSSLGDVQIPIIKDREIVKKIDCLVLEANELRYQAYKQEQQAIEIMNREVLGL